MRDSYEPLESRYIETWSNSQVTKLLMLLGEEVKAALGNQEFPPMQGRVRFPYLPSDTDSG